jgi:hypothetical protein
VAEQEDKSAPIPWLPLITLIGVGSGVLFLSFQQLTSSRPGGGEPRLADNTFDDETVDARLWQDPLGVAAADWEKRKKQDDSVSKSLSFHEVASADREKDRRHGGAHSVGRFQDLVVEKCFATSALYPLRKEFRFVGETKRRQKKRVEEEAEQLQIFAIMIPGGPYVEDVERRLRSRRAVIEGLGIAGYDPEKDDEIGYFFVPWLPLQPNASTCITALEYNRKEDERRGVSGIRPARSASKKTDSHSLLVPYEWCEPTAFGNEKKSVTHILILWLTDDAFRDAPLARLADLISWFRLEFFTAFEDENFLQLPVFTVLGPDNSGTLHNMVLEAKDDPWNDDTRECLATTHVYSSQAAAAESQLLPETSTKKTCKDLIEQKVKRSNSNNGFALDRTILLDDQIVATVWQELDLRGVKPSDDIAIISEVDTYYARSLSASFTHPDPNTVPNTDPNIIPINIYPYTYLRGIDGKLPLDEKEEKEAKSAAESDNRSAQSLSRPTERTEGVNQADDLRRLAVMLHNLDTKLRNKGGEGLKAVGLLGSDVYDKLELLKALRPMLPEAVFFTNNLDARLTHPDEWKETHNLVVVSAHGLSLERSYEEYQRIAPFRDSSQTALFEATLEAMKKFGIEGAKPKSPLIFEIGRNGPRELSISNQQRMAIPPEPHHVVRGDLLLRFGCFVAFPSLFLASNTIAEPIYKVAEDFPWQTRLGCFIIVVTLLLVWMHLVSRVSPEFHTKKAK